MDEIGWFNDVYSDMFSLEFDNLFNTIDFESFESKENDSGVRVNNNTSTASQPPTLTKTTLETNNLPAPDESRFPLTSNETLKKQKIKTQREVPRREWEFGPPGQRHET